MLLVEDAYKNRAKDSLIDAMREQHTRDSLMFLNRVMDFRLEVINCEKRIANLREQISLQTRIGSEVETKSNIYKKSSRRYKRQRNAIGVFLLVVAGVVISRD